MNAHFDDQLARLERKFGPEIQRLDVKIEELVRQVNMWAAERQKDMFQTQNADHKPYHNVG